jgi:hypothetical protein
MTWRLVHGDDLQPYSEACCSNHPLLLPPVDSRSIGDVSLRLERVRPDHRGNVLNVSWDLLYLLSCLGILRVLPPCSMQSTCILGHLMY